MCLLHLNYCARTASLASRASVARIALRHPHSLALQTQQPEHNHITMVLRISPAERHFIEEGIHHNIRNDGRERLDYRHFTLETGIVSVIRLQPMQIPFTCLDITNKWIS